MSTLDTFRYTAWTRTATRSPGPRRRRRPAPRTSPCSSAASSPSRSRSTRASSSSRSPRRGSRARRSCTSRASSACSSKPASRSWRPWRSSRRRRPTSSSRRSCSTWSTDSGRATPSPRPPPPTPRHFRSYYVAMLESAELTGNLDKVLEELADYIERDIDARSQIISALIYPAVVMRHGCRHRRRPGGLRLAQVQDVLRLPECQAPAPHADAAQRVRLHQRNGGTSFWRIILLVVVGVTVAAPIDGGKGQARRNHAEAARRR